MTSGSELILRDTPSRSEQSFSQPLGAKPSPLEMVFAKITEIPHTESAWLRDLYQAAESAEGSQIGVESFIRSYPAQRAEILTLYKQLLSDPTAVLKSWGISLSHGPAHVSFSPYAVVVTMPKWDYVELMGGIKALLAGGIGEGGLLADDLAQVPTQHKGRLIFMPANEASGHDPVVILHEEVHALQGLISGRVFDSNRHYAAFKESLKSGDFPAATKSACAAMHSLYDCESTAFAAVNLMDRSTVPRYLSPFLVGLRQEFCQALESSALSDAENIKDAFDKATLKQIHALLRSDRVLKEVHAAVVARTGGDLSRLAHGIIGCFHQLCERSAAFSNATESDYQDLIANISAPQYSPQLLERLKEFGFVVQEAQGKEALTYVSKAITSAMRAREKLQLDDIKSLFSVSICCVEESMFLMPQAARGVQRYLSAMAQHFMNPAVQGAETLVLAQLQTLQSLQFVED